MSTDGEVHDMAEYVYIQLLHGLYVVTEYNYSYCKFEIAIEQPKRNGSEHALIMLR